MKYIEKISAGTMQRTFDLVFNDILRVKITLFESQKCKIFNIQTLA